MIISLYAGGMTVRDIQHHRVSTIGLDIRCLPNRGQVPGECLMVCVWVPNLHKEISQNDYCDKTRSGR